MMSRILQQLLKFTSSVATNIIIVLQQAGRAGIKEALKQCWKASETVAASEVLLRPLRQ